MIILFLILCILGWLLFKKNKENSDLIKNLVDKDSELSQASSSIRDLGLKLINSNNQVKTLSERVESLEKYQDIIDVVEFIEEKKSLHEATIRDEKERIKLYRDKVVQDAENLIFQMKQEFENTNHFLNKHKEKTLQKVEKEAQELLQEYYEVANEKRDLSRIVKSLENKIQGYGDEYLIPNQALFNDLIDGYEHLDAVTRLKSIRNEVKLAIKIGDVAQCDYVEEHRKKTAIAFITNAFNGQVDAILSRIRHDNFGKLVQEMNDDYVLLNNFGEAFRNTRITEKYLNLRLEELKLASMIQEFKIRERDEQREIREIIREEEKARKEYERAIKEAEREELSLKKAYEKIKAEFDLASEDQKAKYESELNKLNEKLKLAEEKSQRALSMAQQTRAGHVYVISNIGSFGENVLKLGMTRRLDPMDRVKELGDASVPFTFDVHAMIYSEDAPKLEKKLHHYFNHQRVNKINYKKEFFKVSVNDVKEFLEQEDIHAKFTLKAEALQYRESLRIEQMPESEKFLVENEIENQLVKYSLVEED